MQQHKQSSKLSSASNLQQIQQRRTFRAESTEHLVKPSLKYVMHER
jgi:hypothetical protein